VTTSRTTREPASVISLGGMRPFRGATADHTEATARLRSTAEARS
jgi:hypothetical protein